MPSRCCISQLRSDAALSNVPADKAGAASGIYKMASSLGAALGVAISAAIFTALSGLEGELVPLSDVRSEEHTSELQSQSNLVCRLLLEKKKTKHYHAGHVRG